MYSVYLVNLICIGLISADTPYIRHVRQIPTIPPTVQPGFICVAPGTCISASITPPIPPNVIDPRIVAPGGLTPTNPPITNPTSCPAGTVPCSPTAGAAQCGRRFVTSVNVNDGASTYGSYPWQAFIRNQTGFTGSGVLIDTYHVLTAGHKVNLNLNSPGNIEVYIGVWDPVNNLTSAQRRTVVSMRLHPLFNSTTLFNDIAVLRLNAPIALGYQLNVGAACLPPAGSTYIGQNCFVSGWGRSAFSIADAPSNPQKQVTVGIVNYQTCRSSMAQPTVLGSNVDMYLDPNGELCAGGLANRDACTQDGGAPLVCLTTSGYTVAGLVIWGKGCGQAGVYGVYVDVSKYLSFINTAISELSFG